MLIRSLPSPRPSVEQSGDHELGNHLRVAPELLLELLGAAESRGEDPALMA